MSRKHHEWVNPDEIDGLDVPMLDPAQIPEGFQQYWDNFHKKWMLTEKKKSPYPPKNNS